MYIYICIYISIYYRYIYIYNTTDIHIQKCFKYTHTPLLQPGWVSEYWSPHTSCPQTPATRHVLPTNPHIPSTLQENRKDQLATKWIMYNHHNTDFWEFSFNEGSLSPLTEWKFWSIICNYHKILMNYIQSP